jgi:3-oxoacyl-[acyl-carrier-protein] synthase-3
MSAVQIAAVGAYVPEREIRNEDLTGFPREALPLIEAKTGVKARRHAAEGQCTSDLAAEAVRRCLDRASIPVSAVDALVVATSSPDRIQPATAARTQALLGATGAYAFDVNAVCAGALYGLEVGRGLVQLGARCVVIAAAEVYSRILNPADFSTYPYFGDGAGAVALVPEGGRFAIRDAVLHTDGTGADVIEVPAGGTMRPASAVQRPADLFFRMQGKRVYDFAVNKGTEVVRELLDRAGLKPEQLAVLVPHQANVNILREIASRLGLPFSRVAMNLDRYGNTAGAAVLIALEEVAAREQCPVGGYTALVAFGGGLSWAAVLLERVR